MLKLSIGIVAYNEEAFLPNLLKDIKQQKYPHDLMEIVLVDSMSTDETRSIMEEFKKNNKDFYSVQIIENPKKIQAAGWNVVIANFTGDILARIDAHTKVSPEYSEKVMNNICCGENIVGGIRPCIIEKESQWARTLLQTENSLFGSSINPSRYSQEKMYVKTLFHAAYRREVFEKVGLFNESLLRTEDNEMHYRIRQVGYRICYDPTIVSYQYARNSLKKMIRQKYGNGYWVGKTLKICPKCLSLYHVIPALFVLGIIVTTALAWLGIWQIAMLMWSLYGLFAVTSVAVTVAREGFHFSQLMIPALFLVLHSCYGIGTILGVINVFFSKDDIRCIF